jgi:hypothetical protein
MEWSAAFTGQDGRTVLGQLSTDRTRGGELAFIDRDGTLHPADDLRMGKLLIIVGPGRPLPSVVIGLRDAAVAASIATDVGMLGTT